MKTEITQESLVKNGYEFIGGSYRICNGGKPTPGVAIEFVGWHAQVYINKKSFGMPVRYIEDLGDMIRKGLE